ncbi:hypothetical protein [Rhodococcus sp. 114MFTsu3.1]|uniref:hypothetical protein n=1 Tax=Rhodococcus sp. 114MFTsu3.1 TaxID=1172184 RepID=UPI000379A288|nr:hypothetical protein [Rhodococcus sp. 114MFTsu3.1]
MRTKMVVVIASGALPMLIIAVISLTFLKPGALPALAVITGFTARSSRVHGAAPDAGYHDHVVSVDAHRRCQFSPTPSTSIAASSIPSWCATGS